MFDRKILETIGKKLKGKNQTIAVAESVTAGLLQFALASPLNAACFFQGGLTAYNLGQKVRHLEVEPIHASSVDSVSQPVALQMAIHVSAKYSSDWGIAVTGYATPVPESGNRLFAYFAIALKGKIKAKGKITIKEGEPQEVQKLYVEEILKRLKDVI